MHDLAVKAERRVDVDVSQAQLRSLIKTSRTAQRFIEEQHLVIKVGHLDAQK
jgi:hypothetical protein